MLLLLPPLLFLLRLPSFLPPFARSTYLALSNKCVTVKVGLIEGEGRFEGEGRLEGEERLPEGRSTAYTTPSEARVKTVSSLSPFSLLSSILATMACNKLISKVIERDRTALHSENSYCFTQGCMSLSHPGPVMTRARTGFTQLAPSSIKPPYFVYR